MTNYTYLPAESATPEEIEQAYNLLADMVEGGERVLCYVLHMSLSDHIEPCEVFNWNSDTTEFVIRGKANCIDRADFIAECKRLKVRFPKPVGKRAIIRTDQLKETYLRRIRTANDMIDDPNTPEDQRSRLRAKVSCYKYFVVELED